MKLLSVNVGLPREVPWHGHVVRTSIFKKPVTGRVLLRRLNLNKDYQSDLTVHGGRDKAVYCYPSEHYAYWEEQLPGKELPYGVFGENFTTQGMLENALHIGDKFSIGSAQVMITQPRLPCYKLGLRFADDGMVRRFAQAGRSGFYLSVVREGEVAAGDEFQLLSQDPARISVAEIFRLFFAREYSQEDRALLEEIAKLPALPGFWKQDFRERLLL
jgi:MOSC domain-containing protein YiiM